MVGRVHRTIDELKQASTASRSVLADMGGFYCKLASNLHPKAESSRLRQEIRWWCMNVRDHRVHQNKIRVSVIRGHMIRKVCREHTLRLGHLESEVMLRKLELGKRREKYRRGSREILAR